MTPHADRDRGGDQRRRWKRILWFAGLYVASLLVCAAVIYGLRLLVP